MNYQYFYCNTFIWLFSKKQDFKGFDLNIKENYTTIKFTNL